MFNFTTPLSYERRKRVKLLPFIIPFTQFIDLYRFIKMLFRSYFTPIPEGVQIIRIWFFSLKDHTNVESNSNIFCKFLNWEIDN